MFADIKGNPVGRNVEDGVAAYQAAGCDSVIAFGGGSGLDAAKAIALMVGQTRPIWDFEDREDWWTRIDESGIAPIVAVPTTAGTGSEVGRASVITDEPRSTSGPSRFSVDRSAARRRARSCSSKVSLSPPARARFASQPCSAKSPAATPKPTP